MSEREFDSTVTKNLKAAFDILQKQGGCKGDWYYPGTNADEKPFCAEGALQKALADNGGNRPRITILHTIKEYQLVKDSAMEVVSELAAPKLSWLRRLFSFDLFSFDCSRILLVDCLSGAPLHTINDIGGKEVIFPAFERAIAKSEALDREQAKNKILELVAA